MLIRPHQLAQRPDSSWRGTRVTNNSPPGEIPRTQDPTAGRWAFFGRVGAKAMKRIGGAADLEMRSGIDLGSHTPLTATDPERRP